MGRRKKGRGKASKVARADQAEAQENEFKKAPHTFVFKRGNVGKNVGELIQDVRRVMEPYTASNLKVRKKNVLKDFVSVAGVLNVSHLVMFTKTETTNNLRLVRLPRGPTLTFKVNGYTLSRDVISSLKRPHMEAKQFQHHPLLIMNNFSGDGMHLKLMATMFQNMFPSINVNNIQLNEIRRSVLLNYNPETKEIDFRHYNIRAVPVGLSKGLKKLLKPKLPNMSKYNDISEYMLRDGQLSESEAELDGPHNEVVLPQQVSGRGNQKSQKSAIRLTEIGPRMSLQLVKIEEGVCTGPVLFHEFVSKTPQEEEALKKLREEKQRLKQQRKRQQEQNVEKKQQQQEEMKKKCMAGMKKQDDDDDDDVEEPGGEGQADASDDDDVAYYKQEVGEAPDPDMNISRRSRPRKRKSDQTGAPSSGKKKKLDKKTELKDKQKELEKKLKKRKKKKEKKKQKMISKGIRGRGRGRPGKK